MLGGKIDDLLLDLRRCFGGRGLWDRGLVDEALKAKLLERPLDLIELLPGVAHNAAGL